MHQIWSGSISFGLINIPVKLYSGSDDKEVSFSLLHKKDHSRIRYAKICKEEEREIPFKEITKGYEYQKGEFIVLNEKDFEKVNMRTTHTIELVEFTSQDSIDIRSLEKPYYLEPEKGGEKAYALLREALQKTHKIGIATLVLRNREHLAVIKPIGRVIVLDLMRYHSEIRDTHELNLPDSTEMKPKELELAIALINQLTREFHIEDFQDTYTEELKKMIAAKLAGRKIHMKGKTPKETPVKDLMTTLLASLNQSKKSAHKPSHTRGAKKRRPLSHHKKSA